MTEMLQVASEFDQLEALYRELKPSRVLEIGVWQGGTLKVWLDGCDPEATVVAVDNLHVNREAYYDWKGLATELIVVHGISQDANTVRHMKSYAPYDFIFIDADHGYGSVRADCDNCLPLLAPGGVLAFHDLVAGVTGHTYPPGQVVNELEADGYSVRRFIDHAGSPEAHGIGVVQR